MKTKLHIKLKTIDMNLTNEGVMKLSTYFTIVCRIGITLI